MMPFFDWDHDGTIDLQDGFLEYHIFEECTEDWEEETFDLEQFDEE